MEVTLATQILKWFCTIFEDIMHTWSFFSLMGGGMLVKLIKLCTCLLDNVICILCFHAKPHVTALIRFLDN